jgi:ATP-binding cassette subfamily G (WHITE) protein 2 (PDR)
MGVISGSMFVDGRERDESFQRQTGYAMQQDIHLDTSTVREALEFSALLRQPVEYNRKERLAYVDHVIRLLDMEQYADAVVGVSGSGLNVERKSFQHCIASLSMQRLGTNVDADIHRT